MAAKTLVQHWLGFDDSERIRENIFSFLSSQKDEKLIGCDYLESLTMIVSHLLQNNENTTYNERGNVEHEQWINDVLNEILTQICIPTLRMPRPTAYDINKRDKMQIFELTCDLVSRIVCKGPIANEKYIWTLVLKSLKSYVDESRSGVDVGNKADEQLLEVCEGIVLKVSRKVMSLPEKIASCSRTILTNLTVMSVHATNKARTEEQFFLDKFIFLCVRQTVFP